MVLKVARQARLRLELGVNQGYYRLTLLASKLSTQ
jgi:hypothetical protein